MLTISAVRLPRLLMCLLFVSAAHAQTHPYEEKALTIGLIADLTGPLAPLGVDCRQGFETARRSFAPDDVVGGRRVTYIYGDSKGEAKTSVSEFTRMVDSGHAAAVVISRTGMAMPVNPISLQRRFPILASAAHPKFVSGNRYAFREWVRAENEGIAMAKRARKSNFKRLAVITTEDDYLSPMSEGFAERFTADGGQVVFNQSIDNQFSDFSTLLLQAKSKIPDVLMINVSIAQLGVIFRRMHEMGLKLPAYSSYWVFKKEVLETAGAEALEGVTSVEMDFRQPKFMSAVEKIFGDAPYSGMTYSCYFTLAHVLQAIASNQGITTPQDMYEALLKTESISLLDGDIEYKDREVQLTMRYEKLAGGKVDVLEPVNYDDNDYQKSGSEIGGETPIRRERGPEEEMEG